MLIRDLAPLSQLIIFLLCQIFVSYKEEKKSLGVKEKGKGFCFETASGVWVTSL